MDLSRARLRALPLLLALAACTGSDKDEPDPRDALATAKTHLDSTSGVHFALTASPLPSTGTSLESAEGDAAPLTSAFTGEAKVKGSSFSATVKVISVGGVVYVKQPFAAGYVKVNPTALGLVDPGALLSPQNGISSFLTADPKPRADGTVRVGGEVLDRYRATLPRVGVLATDATDVPAEFDLVPASGELRRVVLTGPFFGTETTTITLTLTRYGQAVDIKAP